MGGGEAPGGGVCVCGAPPRSLLTSHIPAAVPNFNNSAVPGAFQDFPGEAGAYRTLNTTLINYPCPKPPGEITVLRVGSETSCAGDKSRPTCNGPLPSPGPYQ